MDLWIAFTIFAALTQTLRFALQKALGSTGLSPGGATFARFLFAAPLATAAACALYVQSGVSLPVPGVAFFGYVVVGGIAQIIATELTVRLMGMRSFATGIAFTKTEVLQAAVASALILGEMVSFGAGLAIAVGFAGLVCLSFPRTTAFEGRPVAFGLAAGALFAVAAICYRGATLSLEPAPFLLRALLALATATVIQSVIMALWLSFREPGEMARVLHGWRRTAPVGITGLLGSLGWFAAFSLQNAAYVRALGQVEVIFTLLFSTLWFREKLGGREVAGLLLVSLSVIFLVLGTG
ncbi:EamA/RhaT family transporter [Pseudotabrizicola sediminis]|uniref:EamA/RhaT family transporter n=1 Tax=Pseudotabrizicola sediminis TaxID=2486418 RepID=A0ABY2KN21_9RHOB|nr:EamA family transporter [Pseudotabrizicola sediminis]TGD43988.1 EamA/RhaT family transporter [Pseudotabrizicola sediminis]